MLLTLPVVRGEGFDVDGMRQRRVQVKSDAYLRKRISMWLPSGEVTV